MIAYAVFPGNQHYHLVWKTSDNHTLCGLSTKGSVRTAGERRPPACVMMMAPRWAYPLCPSCAVEQAQLNMMSRQRKGRF